jgi:acyl dehydratase
LNYKALLAWRFEEIEQAYNERDAILYALGVGAGCDPNDPDEIQYVYEDGLRVLPTMAVTLGYPGFYLQDPRAGVDWKRMLHGEQGLAIHRPLGPRGRISSSTRVDAIVDKGKGRGALVYTTREQWDPDSGESVATLTSTLFCRADGGFGGPSGPVKRPHSVPEGNPEIVVALPTLPQAALIYRMSGDLNPIHVDPAAAGEAGFERPILHGLCTYGLAGRAVLKALCASRPERLRRLDVRFASPAYPGETISTEIWREARGRAAFRCVVPERATVVVDNGYVEFEE